MSRRFDGEQTPAILYKYLTVERAKTVLLDSKVFFACPADFNDPFDCSLPMDFSPRGDVRRRFLRRLVREREPSVPRWLRVAKVRDVLREHPEIFELTHKNFIGNDMRNAGILCLSEPNNDILMWSHYADKHKGVCVGFKIHPAQSNLLVPDSSSMGFFGNALEVDYAESFPFLNLFETVEKLEKIGKIAEEAKKTFVDVMFLTKSTHWSYEKEWRIIACFAGLPCRGAYPFPRALIAEVIFGCQALPESVALVKGWVRSSGANPRFYNAKVKVREFGLDIIPED